MRRAAAIVVVALAVVALLSAVRVPFTRYLDGDFAGFWVGSRMLLDGADPYDRAAFLDMHARLGSIGPIGLPRITGYAYPLPTAIVFAPFALVPIGVAAPLWLVTQLVLVTAALYALGRALFGATLRRDLVVLYGIVFASEPAWLLAAGGNIGGFLAANAAAIATLLLRGRPFIAGLFAGLLIVKPHPLLIAMPLVLLALPRAAALRALGGAACTAGLLLAASFALRPGWVSAYLVPLGKIAAEPQHPPTLFGLVLDPPWLPFAIGAVIALTAAAWVVRAGPSLAVAVGVAVPLSLFLAVYGWSYDQLVLAVPAAIALGLAAHAAPGARTAVLLALALAIDALAWTTYAFAFTVGHEAWSALVPLAVLAVVAFAARIATPRALSQLEGEPQRVVERLDLRL